MKSALLDCHSEKHSVVSSEFMARKIPMSLIRSLEWQMGTLMEEAKKAAIDADITALQEQLQSVKMQIKELGFVGNLSKEFLDRHSG